MDDEDEFTHRAWRRGDEVHIEISGEMTEDDANESIASFHNTLPLKGNFEFHAHLKGLLRYEKAAREAWTIALSDVRERCTRVVIYGAKPLIRMGAATVLLIARLPMEFKD